MTTSNPEAGALLLPLTDTAIEHCRDHLGAHPDTDPAVTSYLARHVNSLMCAEIEVVVSRIIEQRVQAGCSDEVASNFLASLRRNVIRNAKYDEIQGKLKILGQQIAARFEERINETVGEDGKNRLGVAVKKRDDAAHREPPDITFNEVVAAYADATVIVGLVAEVLQQ